VRSDIGRFANSLDEVELELQPRHVALFVEHDAFEQTAGTNVAGFGGLLGAPGVELDRLLFVGEIGLEHVHQRSRQFGRLGQDQMRLALQEHNAIQEAVGVP
jgi:hypothetical protein